MKHLGFNSAGSAMAFIIASYLIGVGIGLIVVEIHGEVYKEDPVCATGLITTHLLTGDKVLITQNNLTSATIRLKNYQVVDVDKTELTCK